MKKDLILGMIIVSLGTMIGCSESKEQVKESKQQIESEEETTKYEIDQTYIYYLLSSIEIDFYNNVITNKSDLKVIEYSFSIYDRETKEIYSISKGDNIEPNSEGIIRNISYKSLVDEGLTSSISCTLKNKETGKVLYINDGEIDSGNITIWSDWQIEGTDPDYIYSNEY